VKGPQLELVMLMFENYGEPYGSSVFDDLYEDFYSLIKVKSINGAKGGRGIATGLCWRCRISAVMGVTLLE
jgi:hypothetical protein